MAMPQQQQMAQEPERLPHAASEEDDIAAVFALLLAEA
jgi:hypothetical protein